MEHLTELAILGQSADWVAVDKPAGLLVHPSALDRGAGRSAMQIVRDQIGAWVYPVHRLDRPTSGVLLFALSPKAARHLAAQFAAREVNKSYLAVVRGTVPESARLDSELSATDHPEAARVAALTLVERLATVEIPISVDRYPTSRYSLVRAKPITGRRHQIRRHLRRAGHPLIGDVTYGVGKHNRFFAVSLGVRRLLLACERMEFRDPRTDEIVCVRAPLAADFAGVLVRLGWDQTVYV